MRSAAPLAHLRDHVRIRHPLGGVAFSDRIDAAEWVAVFLDASRDAETVNRAVPHLHDVAAARSGPDDGVAGSKRCDVHDQILPNRLGSVKPHETLRI